MALANDIYDKLSKKEKLSILKTIDTIVDMNTPIEISKELADELLEKLLSLGVFEKSNILFIESDKSVFQRFNPLNILKNIRSILSRKSLKKLRVKSGF
ncbi:hypothetical protein [Aquimarina algiphila]|uniref:hypothetical protein n=1 Tax=Aquimarina algiphila TaxID=2047982 RepID=UPI00232E9C4F|nr:hypothetical protein [Aquimarina algiphila]